MHLETERLLLNQFHPDQLVALIETPESFEELAGFPAAAGLREFYVSGDVDPAWLEQLKSADAPDPWSLGFAVVDKKSRSVIGSGGFKGPPDGDGVVEIAYGIVPSFENRGYATEVVTALIDYCLDNGARLVRAHTLPLKNASNRILAKHGFDFVGEVNDPADGPVWRWERAEP